MDKLLPLWIIGAPLVFAVIDWMRTPKVRGSLDGYADRVSRPVTPAAGV